MLRTRKRTDNVVACMIVCLVGFQLFPDISARHILVVRLDLARCTRVFSKIPAERVAKRRCWCTILGLCLLCDLARIAYPRCEAPKPCSDQSVLSPVSKCLAAPMYNIRLLCLSMQVDARVGRRELVVCHVITNVRRVLSIRCLEKPVEVVYVRARPGDLLRTLLPLVKGGGAMLRPRRERGNACVDETENPLPMRGDFLGSGWHYT